MYMVVKVTMSGEEEVEVGHLVITEVNTKTRVKCINKLVKSSHGDRTC
jgi:hypothetical protein